MPKCIYCLQERPPEAFQPEHVLTRAFCGAGENWTLASEVCGLCNARFSQFEAHWARQTIEAMARNFHGPTSRNDKERLDRLQPMEIDHLYIVNHGETTVYEAGFAYPNDHHYRPQIIETPAGLLPFAGREADGAALNKATASIAKAKFCFKVTVPLWKKRDKEHLIAVVEPCRNAKGLRIKAWEFSRQPRGIWLRSYPHDSMLVQERLPQTCMTTRLSLDHRGRLYIRSANVETAVRFMERFFRDDFVAQPPLKKVDTNNQHVVFGVRLDLNKLYLAILKNGFNLFCYLFGRHKALHGNFQPLRDMLLNDAEGRAKALRACRFDDVEREDFPKSGNPGLHRMLLDLTPEGFLRFRIRLFDSSAYYAHLGVFPAEWRADFAPTRIEVDYGGIGIHKVDHW